MADRVLNVLLTGNATSMKAAFASATKGATGATAGLAAVAVGAALAGKALYDIGEEFDSAFDKIRVGTGKTGKQLERLKADFKAVYSTTPAGMEEVAEAITEVEKRLGLNDRALRRETKQFVELSRVTGTDVAGNVKAVARAFEDWEVPVRKQSQQLDEFFRATQLSGSSVEDLTTLLAKFGSPLRLAGFSIEEATAMFASFEKTGVNIQTMLPGLRMAIKNLLKEGVAPKNLSKEIKATFKGIEEGAIPATRAMEIFGTKAGADMIEAVNQGRFHLGKFMKEVESGSDTINKAGEETNDLGENLKIFWHKVQVAIAPAAEALYKGLGKLSDKLADIKPRKLAHELGLTKNAMEELGEASEDLADVGGPAVSEYLGGIGKSLKRHFKQFAESSRGLAEVIGGIFHGDIGKVLGGLGRMFGEGFKEAIRRMGIAIAPLRLRLEQFDKVMTLAFGGTWDKVKGIFGDGVKAAIGAIETLVGWINKLPFIPHIDLGGGGPQHSLGADRGENRKGSTGIHRQHRQRGGYLMGGGTGDIIPAMLEPGEYVVNRKAAAAVGKERLDALNFGMAPRFSVGGDVMGAVKKGVGLATGGLPDLHISGIFAGLAPWLLSHAAEWIKGKKKKLRAVSGLGAAGTTPIDGHPVADWIAKILMSARSHGIGFSVTSGYRSYAEQKAIYDSGVRPAAVPGTSHHEGTKYPSGAVDLSPYSQMAGWLPNTKWAHTLEWAGSADPVHFSHHYGGGFQKGGLASWVHGSSTLNPDQLASLAAYVGMKNPAYMGQIAMGESSGNPLAVGHDAGGTEGLGLWQITTGFNDGLIAKYGGRSAMFDPLKNARAAAEILASSGTGAWYAPPTGPKGHISSILGGGGGGGSARKAVKAIAGIGSSAVAGAPFHPRGIAEEGIGKGKGILAGPLRAAALPASVAGLGAHFQKLLRSPGLGYAGQLGISESALSAAGTTEGIADDLAVLAFQEDLYKGHQQGLQKSLAKVSRTLRKGHLKPGRQKKLITRQEELLSDLGSTEGGLISAEEARKQLLEEEHNKAIEENTAAIQDHGRIEEELKSEMKRRTDFAEQAVAVHGVEALIALADFVEGEISGKVSTSRGMSGLGNPGSMERI